MSSLGQPGPPGGAAKDHRYGNAEGSIGKSVKTTGLDQ